MCFLQEFTMNHYYRITAYHKNSNVCLIADSNGKFEKLWQFSSFFVCKGFEIVSVAKEENLSFGNIPKANADSHNILIRACGKGNPVVSGNNVTVNEKHYCVNS